MANVNGLIAPPAYKNPEVPYYLVDDAGTVINQPTLISPIALRSDDAATTGFLTVGGAAAGVYEGAISIQPGANAAFPGGNPVGITVRGIANGVSCEIGDNAQSNNLLFIAGTEGVAQVYDEKYNQPVSLQPITLSDTNPLCAPIPENTGEIFRCEQAGVAASAVSSIGTAFQVPRSGWYALQIEVKLGNAPAPAATTINVPITVATGGVNLGENLSFAIIKGVVLEPYGLQEVSSNELAVAPILVANTITIRTYASLHLFDSTETYTFTLSSSSALWNIGATGQIKAELIAMC
jgi:hypothetical protein